MQFNLTEFLTNPFVPLFFATFTGLLFGKIKIGKFSFGQSGTLFTGILTGWFLYSRYVIPYMGANGKLIANAPKYAVNYFNNGVISNDFFNLTLILFIASVGLLAAKDLKSVMQKFGAKFLVLAVVMVATAALVIYASIHIFTSQSPFAVAGVFTGATTSSPGLAAAIEATAKYGSKAQSLVGLGHTIAYAPAAVSVVLIMNLFPIIFRMDMEKEKQRYREEMGTLNSESSEAAETTVKEVGMDLIAFALVCFIGYFLGSVKFYLPFVKWFSLASTGGVLIAALVFGYIGKIGPLNFRMNSKMVGTVRDLALVLFLSVVGIQNGYASVTALAGSGAILAVIAFFTNFIYVTVGFFFGRYVLKMNWIILSGALCGGATNTPGLGSAIASTKTNEVAAGYGATYPFALILKVLAVIIIHAVGYIGLV